MQSRAKILSHNCGKYVSTLKYFKANISTELSSTRPLANIRVLDMTRILAGPFCTMILGDLGAEVIKVEKPGDGDDTRSWGPPFVNGESCYFISVNRNKKSIAINMKHESGIKLLKDLAVKSDVLVENFIPGKLDELGLGYSDLKSIAPHLIYCSISGYGATGPYSKRSGYDVIAASIGGLLNVTGPENEDPCKVGVAVTDLMTGLYSHGAIMAALLQREKTKLGQKIDCNLLSTQVATLVNLGSNYLNAGLDGKRLGTAHASIVPYEAFKTADGHLTVGAGNNAQFKIFCERLQLEHLNTDPNYASNQLRVKYRKPLLDIIKKRFLEKTNAEWLEIFENCGIPYGAINTMKEVFNDPQVKYNKMVQELNHPVAGTLKVITNPVQYSEINKKIELPPPLLGEHTKQVLSNILHMDYKDIDTLKENNIIQ